MEADGTLDILAARRCSSCSRRARPATLPRIRSRSACRSASAAPTAWSRPRWCNRPNSRSRRSTRRAASSARRSSWRSPTTAAARRRPESLRLADLPEEGQRADLDGDQRRAQRRPADRHARQGALHLHVVLRGPLLQPLSLRQCLGARPAGRARSSIISWRSTRRKTFFLVGSDYAFGRGMLDFTRKYIEKKGGKVVGDEYQPMDATDWTAIISKMRRQPGRRDHLDRRRRAERHAAPSSCGRRHQIPYRQSRRRRGHRQEHGRRCRRHLHLRILPHQHRHARRTRSSWPR